MRDSHRARSRVQVLNLDHRVLVDSSSWLLDGQVEIDTTQDVDRSASVTILDPDSRSGLDTGDPLDGTVGLSKMIRCRRDIWLPGYREWVSIPIFTGPVTGVARDDAILTVQAQGKDRLAMMPVWSSISWRKGERRVDIIEDLMRKGAGEWAFSLPPAWSPQIGKNLTLNRVIGDEKRTVMAQARAQAQAMARQLFYDGRGTLRGRSLPTSSAWVVSSRDMEGPAKWSESSSEVVNVVVVKGSAPSGSAPRGSGSRGNGPSGGGAAGGASSAYRAVFVEMHLRDVDPNHPWARLSRRGVPLRFAEEIEDTSLTSESAAKAAAARRLREVALSEVQIEAQMLPVWTVEPGDVLTLPVGGVMRTTRVQKATLPLRGGLMTLGSVRVYRPRRGAFR